MKRCPACHRFGVVFNIAMHPLHEVCVWKDCHWINVDDIDVDEVEHPIRFQKFIDAIGNKDYNGRCPACVRILPNETFITNNGCVWCDIKEIT